MWDVPKHRTVRLVDGLVDRVLAGRYRLGRLVDDARLSATYAAYEIETREQLTIELLAPPRGAGRPGGAQFHREARRIVAARHRALRVVRSIGIEAGVPFIVADPLDGESLRERLARSGPLSIAESLSVALQVIDAMAVAHAAGLVHANLKPEKIRLGVSPFGAPVATVMGLGVTTLLGTMRDVDTRGVGTLPYLAPEQLTGFQTPDELTDVWGVGVLVFEMIAGQRPFEGRSPEEIGRRIIEGPDKLRRLCPNVPVSLDRIVTAALVRPREQRLGLRDLRRSLDGVLASGEAGADPSRAPAPAARDVIFDCGDPCDDVEGTTDLHLFIETDLDAL